MFYHPGNLCLRQAFTNGGECRQGMDDVANASEFYYQNSHVSQLSTAEVNEGEFGLRNLLPVSILDEHSFKYRGLIVEVSSFVDATLQKFTRETVRNVR